MTTVAPEATAASLSRRSRRFIARRVLWRESSLKRIQNCGRVSVMPDGAVGVRVAPGGPTGRVAGFSGLSTCGSVWSCPVCSAKIAGERQTEITTAVRRWRELGGYIAMVTLTMRHDAGERLDDLWRGLSHAWGKVTSGRGWLDDKALHGVEGFVRVVETTHGCSGWHVHVHALLFLSPDQLDGASVEVLGSSMFDRWRSALVSKGFAAPLKDSGGLDVKVLFGDLSVIGEYFTKSVYGADEVALEVARGDLKGGRGCGKCGRNHRTPFRILEDLATGEERFEQDWRLWREWERASRGKRQMTWSRGLRDRLLDEPERTDEEIAADDRGGVTWAYIRRDGWVRARRHSERLLDAIESAESQKAAVRAMFAYLEQHSIEYRLVT